MPIHEHPSSVHRHAIMLEVVLLQLWIGERMTIVSNIHRKQSTESEFIRLQCCIMAD